MAKSNIHEITEKLTTERICDRLGVSSHSVRHARYVKAFPASWFEEISDMCREAGIPCPMSAFNFRPPAKKHGNGDKQIQGQPQ